MTATFSERYNKQDAAALATMFVKDAVRVSSTDGAASTGPQAIAESFKTQFKLGFNHIDLIVDQVSPLGTDAAVTTGRYQTTGRGEGGLLRVEGHWTQVEVREAGAWKIRLLTVAPKTEPNAVTARADAVAVSVPGAEPAAASVARPEPVAASVPRPEAVAANGSHVEPVAASAARPDAGATSVPRPEAVVANVPHPEAAATNAPRKEAATVSVARVEAVATSVPRPESVVANVPRPEAAATNGSHVEPVAASAARTDAGATSVPRPDAVVANVPRPEAAAPNAPRKEAAAVSVARVEAVPASAPRIEAVATNVRPELKSSLAATPIPENTKPVILINIDKSKQRMTVSVDGVETFDWPVSTGRAGYSTPSGNYTATSMNEIWYSRQWDNAPMPHSVFFMKDGHAIHGSNDVKNLGKPASHGCVRISPENATTLYALVGKSGLENTHVVLSGVTPGGEYRGAGPASAARYYQPAPGAYEYGYATQGYAAQLRMQPAIAGRSGGYYAPQGYYVVPRPYTQQW
jgi:lipoprotein-anchoring transpeptidase ErfK/SrfK